jgi:transposase
MTAGTVSNPCAATHQEAVRCLFAIELSKRSWIVAFNTPLSDRIDRHTLKACNWQGLLALIDRVQARARRGLGRRAESITCYEAGYDEFWLHRVLEAHGVCNYVINPTSLRINGKLRPIGSMPNGCFGR